MQLGSFKQTSHDSFIIHNTQNDAQLQLHTFTPGIFLVNHILPILATKQLYCLAQGFSDISCWVRCLSAESVCLLQLDPADYGGTERPPTSWYIGSPPQSIFYCLFKNLEEWCFSAGNHLESASGISHWQGWKVIRSHIRSPTERCKITLGWGVAWLVPRAFPDTTIATVSQCALCYTGRRVTCFCFFPVSATISLKHNTHIHKHNSLWNSPPTKLLRSLFITQTLGTTGTDTHTTHIVWHDLWQDGFCWTVRKCSVTISCLSRITSHFSHSVHLLSPTVLPSSSTSPSLSYLDLSTSFIFCSRSILLLRSLSSSCRRESTLVSSRSFLSSSSGRQNNTNWKFASQIFAFNLPRFIK